MKELTLKEKAKAYDEAIEKLRSLHDDYDTVSTLIDIKEELENIFPELKESEDEKISKQIISFLKEFERDHYRNLDFSSWIAWLEKQGEKKASYTAIVETGNGGINALVTIPFGAKDSELQEASYHIPEGFHAEIEGDKITIKKGGQKPFDYENANIQQKDFAPKQEPKFKVGDWITTEDKGVHEDYRICRICKVDNDKYYIENGDFFNKGTLDAYEYHLWTVEDAKDGDVLVNGSNIFIFHFINDTRLMGYCHVNTDDGRFYDDIGKNECFCLIDAVVNPATKEQRDLLFQKMKEHGYEWDDEKKELKLLITNGGDFESENCEQKPANEEMIETLRTEYEKGRADAVAEMQKDWSEEDEERIKNIISVLDAQVCWDGATGKKMNPYQKEIDWLYSLKNRVQPKQEWSEEDKLVVEDIEEAVINYWHGQSQEDLLDWLKSLKDRIQPKHVIGELKKVEEPELTEVEESVKNLMDAYRDTIRASMSTQLLDELNKLYKVCGN